MLKKVLQNNLLRYFILIIIYWFGLYQYSLGRNDIIESITPIFFSVIALLITLYSLRLNTNTIIFLGFILVFSLFVSAIGTNTGQVFGDFEYGRTLGPQIYNTPLVIGTIWIIIILGSLAISRKLGTSKVIIILNAAMIATIFNVLLEPLATHLGYWVWDARYPGLFNYISWLTISLIFSTIAVAINTNYKNSIAGMNLIMLLVYLLIIIR